MIDLRAELNDGEATVTVRDRGGWREPRGSNRGRGIPVMKEFMDDVDIETGERGTTVGLRRRIGGGS
jgi:anti-sigma regulatory factor (Ser/Thr protein kinase)